MAIARVQVAGTTSSGASVGVAFASNNTGGNLLIACVASETDSATVTSLTDTLGNTWAACHAPLTISAGSGKGTLVGTFYAKNCAAGANTVTAALSGGPAYIHVMEYSGCDTTAPFDQHAEAAQLGGSANPTVTLGTATTQADEVLIGFVFNNRSTITAGTGYTKINSQAFNIFSDVEEKIVAATSAYTADSTISAGGSWAIGITTFKQAAPTGGTPDHLAMVTQPNNSVSGIAHTTQPAVAVKDVSNVTVSSDTSTVTASLVTVTGTGTAIGALTKVCSSGQAFFTDLGVTSAGGGTFKWHFTDGALTAVDSAVFTVSSRPNSPYLNLGTDGKDLGYDKSLVDPGIAVALSGDRRSVTEVRPGGASQFITYNAVNRAQLPRTLINSDMPTWTQLQAMTPHSVSGDAQLQALLSGGTLGTGGHVVVVDNSVVYTADYRGAFPLRSGGDAVPGGTNVCILISKAFWDSMVANAGTCVVAPEKKRITSNANMAIFEANQQIGNFMVDGATKGWRFVGLAFRPNTALTQWSHVLDMGNGDDNLQTTALANIPSNIIVDRCWLDGHSTCSILHGFELHCAYGAIVDCASGNEVRIRFNGESHVICGYNGPGPYRVVNNLINGGTEAFIIGGALSACGMPSDLEFRYNYLTRPFNWNPNVPTYDGIGGSYNKNIWETKATQFALIEYNVLEHSWQAAQDGAAFNVKSESYGNGGTIGYTADITIRRNLIRDTSMGTNVIGVPNVESAHPPQRVWFQDNLFRVGAQYYPATSTRHVLVGLNQDCGFVHNTFISEGTVGVGLQLPTYVTEANTIPGFVYLDNIQENSTYETWKAGGGSGNTLTDIIDVTGGSYTINKNAVIGANGNYPTTTYAPADEAAIVFEDVTNKDFSLHGTTQGVTLTPTQLLMVTQPSNASTGVPHATQPVVRVADAGSATVTADTSTVTAALVAVTGTGTAIGTLTKAAVTGVADFAGNGLGVTSAGGGTFKWHFTDGTLTAVDSAVFTVSGSDPNPPPPSGSNRRRRIRHLAGALQ